MRISDEVKVDTALKPQSLATTNATGAYHSLKRYGKALFVCGAAAMAATKTVVWQLFQATDGIGTGAVILTGMTCTATANTGVASVTVTGTTVIATNTIVINGKTFTCMTSGAVVANGEFNIGGSDTLTMASLAATINVCFPELYALGSGTACTIVARDKGEAKVTIGAASGTLVSATNEAVAIIEVTGDQLTAGFTHVALKATTDATIVVSGDVLRFPGRNSPVQQVAASDFAV